MNGFENVFPQDSAGHECILEGCQETDPELASKQRKASEHEHVEAGARSFVSPAVFLSDCALGDAQVLARRLLST